MNFELFNIIYGMIIGLAIFGIALFIAFLIKKIFEKL